MVKGNRALTSCHIVWAGIGAEEKKRTGSWLSNMSCRIESSISNQVTHVIAAQTAWKKGHKIIDSALEENENRAKGNEIKFVMPTWAEDCASNRSKKSEGPYLCEKRWFAYKGDGQPPKKGGSAAGSVVSGARNHVGMLKETLLEATEQHIDERAEEGIKKEVKRHEKRRKREEQVRLEMEKEEAEERMQTAQVFQKGAKKARNDIFTENYHIYMDDTGFNYDVPITKVDTLNNRNERYNLTLQIYESNAEPYLYACNVQFSGTSLLPSNNLFAAIGTPFPTAFHSFKSCFNEKTGIEWDDRYNLVFERAKTEFQGRDLATANKAGTRMRVPVAANGEAHAGRMVKAWKDTMFEYHPPRYGPRGKLPEDKTAEINKLIAFSKERSGSKVQRKGVDASKRGGLKTAGDCGLPSPGTANTIERTEHVENDEAFDDQFVQETALHSSVDPEQLETFVDKTFPFRDWSNVIDLPNDELDSPADPATMELDVTSFETAAAALCPDPANLAADYVAAPSAGAEQSISFNLPPSTVIESFQTGTQDIAETQRVERAMGEFEEAMEHEQFAGSTDGSERPDAVAFADAKAEAEGQIKESKGFGLEKSIVGGLKLGRSMLGKRKTGAAILEETMGKDQRGKKAKVDTGTGPAGEENQ